MADLNDVLARWAEALGGGERLRAVRSITKRGKVAAFGSAGVLEELAAPGGYYSNFKLEVGFSDEVVIQGDQAWQKRDGNVGQLEGFARAMAMCQMWMTTSALLLPERGAPVPELAGESEDGTAWVLTIPLAEGVPYQILIDKQSGLPQRTIISVGAESMHRIFEDWRTVAGVRLPFRETNLMLPQDERILYEFTEIAIDLPLPPEAFDRPAEDAPPFTFANGENSLGIPFEVVSNKVLFEVGVNGRPAWFILDTGAGSTSLDTDFARGLGLEMTPMGSSGGAGVELVDTYAVQGVRLELPGMTFREQSLDTVPLGTGISSVEGRPIHGLFGGNLIGRLVIEVDYARRLLHFYDPAHYPGRSTAGVLPVSVQFGLPFVQAVVTLPGCAPVEGNFLVDLGVRAALSLSTPFVNRHNLMQSAQELVPTTIGWGIGGQVTEHIGRGDLQLGGHAFRNIVIGLSQATAGAESAEFMNGIIGGQIMRRFFLVLDYSRQRLLLEPNADHAAPFEFDMSGMFIRSNAPDFDRLFVLSVTPGSAAAQAGLQPGDELALLDGQPFTTTSVEQVRQMFLQPARTCILGVRRGDRTFEAALTTRRLV